MNETKSFDNNKRILSFVYVIFIFILFLMIPGFLLKKIK